MARFRNERGIMSDDGGGGGWRRPPPAGGSGRFNTGSGANNATVSGAGAGLAGNRFINSGFYGPGGSAGLNLYSDNYPAPKGVYEATLRILENMTMGDYEKLHPNLRIKYENILGTHGKRVEDLLKAPPKVTDTGINTSIIDNALKNLPPFAWFPNRPTPPVAPPNNPPPNNPPPPANPPPTNPPPVNPPGGQVPPPPATPPGGDTLGDILDRILDIFRFPTGSGGGTPPFFPGGDVTDIDDLLNLPIFGGGGQGGTATATGGNATGGNATGGNASNSLSDLIGDIVNSFDFGGLIGDLGDTVINNALSADAFEEIGKQQDRELAFRRGIYDEDVRRLDPYNRLGLRNIYGAEAAAKTNPTARDVFEGQEDITTESLVRRMFEDGGLPALQGGSRALNMADPNVSYTAPNPDVTYNAPTRTRVNVNANDPFNSDDPGMQFLIDEMMEAVQGSAAARGGLLSGDAVEELQDRAGGIASARARELQDIFSARDSLDLAADNQFFNQGMGLAGLDLGAQDQEFRQMLSRAGLDLGAQGQEFGQTLALDDFLDDMNRQDLTDAARVRAQLFGEDISGSTFDRDTEQIEVANKLKKNAQLYDQLFNANQQDLGFDQNAFNQLLALVTGGQNSAAGQASMGQGFADSIGNILTDRGYLDFTERSDHNDNYMDFISRLIT